MQGKRTLAGRPVLLLIAAGALLAAAGCEENVSYGYFLVDVLVKADAPQDFRDRIAVCGVTILDSDGATIAEDSLKCPKCSVKTAKIGVIDWSTNRKGGSVSFVVTVNDIANDPNKVLGKGMSGPLTIMPNGQANGTVEVTPSPNWLEIGANGGLCPID